MLRAKFETFEKQREYFLKVKEKLGVGSKKLSEKLGLKSLKCDNTLQEKH